MSLKPDFGAKSQNFYPSHCWYAAFLTMPRAGFPGPLFPFAPEASEANGNNEALDGNTEALDGNTDANNASLGSKPQPRESSRGLRRAVGVPGQAMTRPREPC